MQFPEVLDLSSTPEPTRKEKDMNIYIYSDENSFQKNVSRKI